MAEVQLIRSGERTAEACAKTKSSSSTQFSEMLKGMTQSASEDKKVSDTKQQKDDGQTAEKKESEKTDSKKEEPTQKTEKIKDGKEEKTEVVLNELTGEDFTQLAEMLAALSQQNSPLEQEPAEEQGNPVEFTLEAVTEGVGGQAEDITEMPVAAEPDRTTEAVSIPVQTDAKPPSLKKEQQTGEIRQEEEVSVQQSPQKEEIFQEEAFSTEASEKEAMPAQAKTDKVRGRAVQATEEEQAKPSEEGGAAVSAVAQHTTAGVARPLADTTAGVVKMAMKTSPEELPKDLADVVVTKDMLGNGSDTLEITLEPAVLGRITLRVVYQEGRAAVSLISNSPKTLELLSQKAGEIAQILEEKTGQNTVVFVPETSYTEQGQEDSAGQESRGRGQQQERPKQEQTESFAQQLRLGLL